MAASAAGQASQAESFKLQGNKAFLAKRYSAAADFYTDAIVRMAAA